MQREILIKCAYCDGHGKQPLSATLATTLRMIPLHGTRTADELAGPLGISREAASMRLLDLFMAGLVRKSGDDRPIQYSRKPLK